MLAFAIEKTVHENLIRILYLSGEKVEHISDFSSVDAYHKFEMPNHIAWSAETCASGKHDKNKGDWQIEDFRVVGNKLSNIIALCPVYCSKYWMEFRYH